jgi:hypothetical protein
MRDDAKGSMHMGQSGGVVVGSGVDANIRIKRFTGGCLDIGICVFAFVNIAAMVPRLSECMHELFGLSYIG